MIMARSRRVALSDVDRAAFGSPFEAIFDSSLSWKPRIPQILPSFAYYPLKLR
jgi:hypothetical protein